MKRLLRCCSLLFALIAPVSGRIACRRAAEPVFERRTDRGRRKPAHREQLHDGSHPRHCRRYRLHRRLDRRYGSGPHPNGGSLIELTFDKDTALVDGRELKLGAAAFVDKGVTYVPLRFVGEQLGLQVYWDSYSKSVFLYNPQSANPDEGDADGDEGIGTEDGEIKEPGGEMPAVPEDALAVVKEIQFDGARRVSVLFEGSMTPNEPFWSGTKLVIDIPYASLSPEIMADLAARKASQAELITDDEGARTRPLLVLQQQSFDGRVVFDLKVRQDYEITLEEGALHVDFVLEEFACRRSPNRSSRSSSTRDTAEKIPARRA